MKIEIGKPNVDGSCITVIEELAERYKNEKVYLCRCECGSEKCKGELKIRYYYLKKIKSCQEIAPRFEIGKPNVDGSCITVIEELAERYPKTGEKIYLCRCGCGSEKCKGELKVKLSDLKRIKSCLKGRPRKKDDSEM